MSRRLSCLISIVLLLFAGAASAEETAAGAILWQQPLGGQVWSPLTLNQGLLYFGCDDGRAVAFDTVSRTLRWEVATGGRVRSAVTHFGGRCFFASDDGYLYAVEAESGGAVWRFDLGAEGFERGVPAYGPPYTYDYLQSSAVINDGRLFVGSADGHLYAVNPENGEELWRFPTDGMVRSTPLVRDGAIWFGSWDGTFYAIEAATGALRWKKDLGGIIQGSPAYADGKVFVGCRGARVHALDAVTGEPRWEFVHTDGSWVESSPVVSDGLVFVGSSDALKLQALDPADGGEQWSYRTGGWSWATPLVADGSVYIGGISAAPYYMPGIELAPGLHAVDIATQEVRWVQESGRIDGYITGGVFSTPVVDGDVLYFAGLDGVLYAVRR